MPDYYIWTENFEGQDFSGTVLKYQTTINKKIAGIDISFQLLPGSNVPTFESAEQSTTNGWENAGDVHAANWPSQAIQTSAFKIVMAGAINQALDSQGLHGTLANFKNTTFTITDVQIADGSANLVSASDISLTEAPVSFEIGDVNKDFSVNVADVQRLLFFINKSPEDKIIFLNDPENDLFEVLGKVNADEDINVADIQALLFIINNRDI